MPVLWAASLRHLVRHPAQLLLALIGLSVGVGTIIAVDIATASSGRAFQLSMQAVNGAATHAIVGGPQGVDERLYVELRTAGGTGGVPRPALAPVVEGYITVGERDLQLVGVDPLAAAEVGAGEVATSGGPVSGRPTREPTVGRAGGGRAGAGDGGYLTSWFTRPGAVVMAAGTARDLGLTVNQSFEVQVGGRAQRAVL